MIPIVLYSSAVAKTRLSTSPEEDKVIREELGNILRGFGWNVQYLRTHKDSSWTFSKVFGTDLDLQGTRYKHGITFAKFLDELSSMEIAIEGSVKKLVKTRNFALDETEEQTHVELAIRSDDHFWLVRSFLTTIVVNYYIPRDEKSKIRARIYEVFKPPVNVVTSLRDIDDEITLICARLSFPYGYTYRILSYQRSITLTNTLRTLVSKHYGHKYEDREDIASAIILAYEGRFGRAKEIALEGYDNSPVDLKKVKTDLVANIEALEEITAQETNIGKSLMTESEKDEALRKLRARIRRLGILYPTRSIYQLNVDVSSPIRHLRDPTKSFLKMFDELNQ